jgi:hypothetical protein
MVLIRRLQETPRNAVSFEQLAVGCGMRHNSDRQQVLQWTKPIGQMHVVALHSSSSYTDYIALLSSLIPSWEERGKYRRPEVRHNRLTYASSIAGSGAMATRYYSRYARLFPITTVHTIHIVMWSFVRSGGIGGGSSSDSRQQQQQQE